METVTSSERNRRASRQLLAAKMAKGAGILALGALLLAIEFFLANRPWKGETFDRRAESLCLADYARAKSPADSLIVDQRVPVVARTQAGVAVTCGTMRQAGRFNH